MTEKEQKKSAKQFAEFWKDKGYEKGQSQSFWLQLLSEVFGIEKTTEFIEFEDQVHIDKSTGFIDAYIPSTKILIEQKSIDKDLKKAIRQSDGSLLNPFQQAKKYITELPVSKHPKWVITCNFRSFLIYNMENPNGEPEEILLKDLEKEYYRLQFIVDTENSNLKKEIEVSIQAGELVGKLYDQILPLYKDPENEETLRSLNMLCVRLVFCLYAEDAEIFGRHGMFHDYLSRFEAEDIRRALLDLFKVLDTKYEDRDPYMKEELSQFPYVNGGLFAEENIEIPLLNEKVKTLLLTKASEDFDWSNISPTIFGAVFESTLNPETRRSGGMHYTSIENIHKVIDPLFLNELKEELEQKILDATSLNTIKKNVLEFQEKISKLKLLDPACGSGNFLTETYLSLRKLENKALEKLYRGQIQFGDSTNSPIKVSINQFYGIEINDFAVTVAKTALWIAESQMLQETENILHLNLDFLPLKSYTNIVEANALRIDWNEIIDKNELNYIMGNPPFVGARLLNQEQRKDINIIFKNFKNSGNLDYVCCWYKKICDFIKNTKIKAALVSTSSIVEGESIGLLWKPLFKNGINFDFAYTSFKWSSEAKEKAQVFCVIIGFSNYDNKTEKIIFTNTNIKKVNHINAYLNNAPDVFVERINYTLCNIPKIHKGCQPTDGGNLIIEAKDYENFIKKEPNAKKYIKKLIGAKEFLQNKHRYCLWLVNVSPSELKQMPLVFERVQKCKEMRLSAKDSGTKKLAEKPTEFRETYNYDNYLVIPKLTSVDKRYIPMGFFDKNVISTDLNYITENATLYHFGVLESNVHMAWMRVVCGRMGNAYRYSAGVVYNNFPWPNINKEEISKIEKTAQRILDARVKYNNSTISDLYNETLMPPELRKAHQENDKAVMEAYGFDWRKMTESDCVAELMKMYQKLVEENKLR